MFVDLLTLLSILGGGRVDWGRGVDWGGSVLSLGWLVLLNSGVHNWVLLLGWGSWVSLVRSVDLGVVDGGKGLLWCLIDGSLWCLWLWLSWVGWVGSWLAVDALLWVWDDSGLVVGNLDDGWASNDVVVRWGTGDLLLGEDNVRLASWSHLWDDDLVVLAGALKGSLNRAGDGDEVGSLGLNLLGAGEGDLVTGLASAGHSGDGWESVDWERAVLRGDGGDERSSKSDNLVEVKRDVERSWERRQLWLLVGAEVGRVASLNSEDRPSSGQVGGISDELSSTEVGADTDTLKDVGDGEESLDVLEAESVGVWHNGLDTGGGKSTGEELNVGLLVGGDLLEVGVEDVVVSSSGEVSLGELGKTLLVEGVLEVLEGEGVVEDDSVTGATWGSLALNNGSRNGGSREGGGDDGRTHYRRWSRMK